MPTRVNSGVAVVTLDSRVGRLLGLSWRGSLDSMPSNRVNAVWPALLNSVFCAFTTFATNQQKIKLSNLTFLIIPI